MTRTAGSVGVGAPDQLRPALMRLGRHWGWYAFFGVLTLAMGILALAWPGATLVVLAVVFGVQLVVSGVFRLVGALVYDDASGGARALMAILGLLGLLIGLYALRHVVITLLALGMVLGIYWVIDGITELFVAIEHAELPGRGWVAVSGGLGVVAGIVLLSWPSISLFTLALIAGIWLLCFGVLQLTIASRLRRLSAG